MIEIVLIKTLGEESIAVRVAGENRNGMILPMSDHVSYYPLGTTFQIDIDGESKRIDPVLPAYSDS
jgi:hypothetical protein